MITSISVDDVIREHNAMMDSAEGDPLDRRSQARLNKLADQWKYEAVPLECGASGAETDDVRDVLSRFGSDSFAKYMYGD